MLSLTKRTEYALIALHYMLEEGAVAEDGKTLGKNSPASAREISERYHVPLPLLMNILKKLSTEGVLVSIRGARGGYAVAVNAREFSLADLVTALEGPVALVDCCCPPEKLKEVQAKCKTSAGCPVRGPLHVVHEKLMKFLQSVSLWEVCRKRDAIAALTVRGDQPASVECVSADSCLL